MRRGMALMHRAGRGGRGGRPPQSSILGGRCKCFPPSRWLMDETYEPPTNSVSHSKYHSNTLCPRKGAFIVFSDGHRDCLGKGFGQAEFCAVIADITERLLDRVGTARGVYTIRGRMEPDARKRMEGSGRQKKYDELQNVRESSCAVCS
ncbi:uncharacterized protein Aud_005064 [Aspergillus udagawae]|uniref:Uncharacterized protein n=1 Tax=Aspergillus udagawae TaxID=91492 RepID=A0A8E0QNR1_9EURO|nr:uncharacterized protein Aud_005064 [Aspergillus udagawae]GIC88667.1 hypothetical protein Aud_005064 [Aspergillus udagawae]